MGSADNWCSKARPVSWRVEKNSDELEGKNHCWYLATVLNNGSNHVTQMYNLLSNVWNLSRGVVLSEPFPGTVIQGVILVFIIVNSLLYVVELGMPTEITTLEPWWVR